MNRLQSLFPAPHGTLTSASLTDLPPLVLTFLQSVADAGGLGLVVGGFVRDKQFDLSPGDIDLEVFGVDPAILAEIAANVTKTRQVGRSFNILKLGDVDVTIPRASTSRTDYLSADPFTPLAEAAQRRDFTLNAIAWDPLSGALYDPWGGLDDLHKKILRHVHPLTFVEDPLRAFRAVRFCSRFGLELDSSTAALCRSLTPELTSLPSERLLGEFEKLLNRGVYLRHGFDLGFRVGLWDAILPELLEMQQTPLDLTMHPEGSVWEHTLLALEQAATLPRDDNDFAWRVAVLLHDVGRCAEVGSGQAPTVFDHAEAGAAKAVRVLSRFTSEKKRLELVQILIRHHEAPIALYNTRSLERSENEARIRRLSVQAPILGLERLARADHLGRATPDAASGRFEAGDWLLEQATQLNVLNQAPLAIVRGRDLALMGIKSGPTMGRLLDQLYQWQLDGRFLTLEEGLTLAQQ